MAAAIELFPIFARAHVLRTWAGVVDVTPDASPIVGLTPIENLYLNCGWGTGGFKATPGVGWCFAHTVATGTPHPYVAPFTLDRFTTGRPDRRARRRRGGATDMQLITCPWCGAREETEFHYGGQAHVAYPVDPAALTDAEWAAVRVLPRQPQGPVQRAVGAFGRVPALVQRAARHRRRTS